MEDQPPTDRISDVARPGKTAATPTSKPIITGHGPMAADPFLQPKVADPLLQTDKAQLSDSKQKTITPPAGMEQSSDNQSTTDRPQSPDQPSIGTPKPASSTEETAKQEHLAKLIDEKTYFLPVGSVAKRRGNLIVIIVLGAVVIAAALGFYLMNR